MRIRVARVSRLSCSPNTLLSVSKQAALYGAGCWAQNQVSTAKAGVAAATSGCGEHLIQTLLAKTCSDAVRLSSDFSGSLATVFQKDFIGSEFLRTTSEKFGGVLILKSHSDGPHREVELSWAHSTASMCVGYMDRVNDSPKVFMSRLDDNATPGTSYTMGGHMVSFVK
ncbi:threonine aspartase 1-like [Elysia marginata]|uniref:Threonine aspartase 1-like n=1 Tax=Elysia marginata TaxID=1093978 RepID=A0AAV4G4S6_9GAST|nr:threonine aspartase 1-like [Elysia marginata]